MNRELSLVILKKKRVVDYTRLSTTGEYVGKLLPKRKPEQKTEQTDFWVVESDKRQSLVNHVDKIFDTQERVWGATGELSKCGESLQGFFGLRGIENRWSGARDVVWGLYYSTQNIILGERLKG